MGTSHPDAAIAVPPTLFLSDTDVAGLADWPSAIRALHQAYAGSVSPAMVPPRSMARGDGLWLRALTAVSPSGGHLGCKLISASMTHRRASYLISLFDQTTMGLAALIDGNRITGIRTAATAAVAVDTAAPQRPLRVAVIGAGFEARGLLLALASVRALAAVQVFSPTPASRERFAADMRSQTSLEVVPVASPQDAVRGADVLQVAHSPGGHVRSRAQRSPRQPASEASRAMGSATSTWCVPRPSRGTTGPTARSGQWPRRSLMRCWSFIIP